MLSSQRNGDSQTSLPVALDHVVHRNMEEKVRQTRHTKLSKELVRMAGCLHEGDADLGVFSEQMERRPGSREMCLCVLIPLQCWEK